jgi:hypothetical protein
MSIFTGAAAYDLFKFPVSKSWGICAENQRAWKKERDYSRSSSGK